MPLQYERSYTHAHFPWGGGMGVVLMHESWQPPTDVYETSEAIIIVVEIGGVSPDELNIQLDEAVLVIRGRRTRCTLPDQVAIHRLEIARGDFDTHVHLPAAIDREAVTATYRDGLLTITLPKEKTRTVHIQVGE